ncbi:MAG TPA: UDP-N-acetylmuramoyl-L-alanyl-D-glutamate--2,6-diaminopimelate ligase [Levilinea sp.]|nr:UDP-N-acetylmuramoyl-L-alanyl-D-glutamate--2,6-diaminopimelate ligase [Levilinea sp.]
MTGLLPKTLRQLFEEIPVGLLSGEPLAEVPVTGIVHDSRRVAAGNVFVALVGSSFDGHQYIPDAIQRGAAAIVGCKDIAGLGVPYVQVSDTRIAVAHLAAAFFNFPARRMIVTGVTGTDGKTTTSSLIYQILLEARIWAGMISTVNAVIGDEVLDTGYHVTTPEAPEVQRFLRRMMDAGLTHVVLEATSHGLAQHRVTACEFDIGVVTNITHEHLDYHGTFEAYRDAKAMLFRTLGTTAEKPGGIRRLSVLNRDDASYEYLKGITPVRTVSYGLHPEADVTAVDVHHAPDGLQFTALGPGFRVAVNSKLLGAFNVSNILAAMTAAVVGMGIAAEKAARGVAALNAIPGRMESIAMGQDFLAVVDFAHTPNALRNALSTAHGMTKGRVIAVFGSAGLRDRLKRRMMAEVSHELADVTILTAEDPRTESLDDILAEMACVVEVKGGLEGESFLRIRDRGEAIMEALRMARPGDLVIACGKGHEQSMCFGETEYPWDDRTAMRAALSRLLGKAGPPMPYLPTQD